MLPHRDMDGDVFVLSDMTIEVHRFAQGEVLGFNGTVEWALDSVEFHEALWMPREDQRCVTRSGRPSTACAAPGTGTSAMPVR